MRLGRAGRAWEFIPIALQALRIAPQDSGVRLLLAANAASLGLVTLAREQMAALAGEVAGHADVRGLAAELERLAPDGIDAAARMATLQGNLAVLAERGVDLRSHLARWRAGDAGREWFGATDGNVFRRRGEALENFGDHVGAARRFAQTHLSGQEGGRPLTVEGLDPAWLALEVAASQFKAVGGYQPVLTLIQADVMEAMDGLAQADMRELLGSPRVRVFIGADASSRLAQDLRDRFDTQVVSPYIPLSNVRTRAVPSVQRVIGEAEAAQQAEHRALRARVEGAYRDRDRAWWSRRYAEALGGGAPLRVLVPTCRYSTYIQHAARDLVSALGAAGHEAELVIEPDDHSRLSSLAYLRVLDRFEPDLVILINYTRAHLGELFPERLPFVCWVQDSMGHQYDASIGAKQGSMDFLVGHLAEELFEQYGYPRERSLSMPVVTSARTFHAGPVGAETQRRFECEVAWVSHHSEDPAAMHARLKAEIGAEMAPVLERMQGDVERIARDGLAGGISRRMRAVTAAALRESGAAYDESVVTQLYRLYARPLADRLHRHQTLEWAAEIADRRGWRLRVHGRGWEAHPRFGRYAAGELAHDDELRACYQCAGVHLHMTINNIVHQRVMECALSGGLPVCRLNAETVGVLASVMKLEVCRGEAVRREVVDGAARLGFSADGTEGSRAMARLLERAGARAPEVFWVREDRLEAVREGAIEIERRADWLLGDLEATTFTTPEGLERIIERSIEDADWRRRTSEEIAGRVRERLTDDAFVGHVLALVRGSLDEEA